jgi:hypothetical protein
MENIFFYSLFFDLSSPKTFYLQFINSPVFYNFISMKALKKLIHIVENSAKLNTFRQTYPISPWKIRLKYLYKF